jgi:hypothetical protein
MGAQEHFAEIITDTGARRINFQLGGLSVTASGLARVAQALRGRRITVYRYAGLPDDVTAEYKVERNALLVRAYSPDLFRSISSRAAIVHECVHALIDLNRATATTHLTGEAAAYLAQGLYRLLHGDRFREWARANRSEDVGRIFYEAIQLIDRFNLQTHSAALTWQDYTSLRDAVHRHPRYQDVSSTDLHGADGIP